MFKKTDYGRWFLNTLIIALETSAATVVLSSLSAYVFSQESTSARMVLNGKNWLLLNRTFLPEEVIGGYNNVTLDDLENVKKLITDFSQYTFSVVSDREIETDAILERS